MKQLFLRSVKIKKHKKDKQSIQNEVDHNDNMIDSELGFDLEDYEQEKQDTEDSNIEGLKNYSFSFENIVTYKEARTSIEEKRPFIVAKRGRKTNVAEEVDTIYKTLPKMKISKNAQRIGFIVVDDKPRKITFKDRNKNRYRGVINNEFLITKKKEFNHKKVGYLPLINSSSDKELYVEVITDRGYLWLVTILIIMCLCGLIVNTKDFDGWHFKKENFIIYKTQEALEYKDNELQVTLNATPVLNDGYMNINLSSEEADNITYIARLYDENNTLIFESQSIKAGEGIESIALENELDAGEYEYKLICETFKNNNYIGEIESDIILKVKTAEN